MRVIVGTVLACVAAACASPPQGAVTGANVAPVAEQAASGPASTSEDGDKQICRMMPVTGSHRSTKVCATQAEWTEASKKSHESVDRFERERSKSGGVQGLQ